jgi:hypothetical protein
MFSIYIILPAALGSEVYSACNRNEYQKQKNNTPRPVTGIALLYFIVYAIGYGVDLFITRLKQEMFIDSKLNMEYPVHQAKRMRLRMSH